MITYFKKCLKIWLVIVASVILLAACSNQAGVQNNNSATDSSMQAEPSSEIINESNKCNYNDNSSVSKEENTYIDPSKVEWVTKTGGLPHMGWKALLADRNDKEIEKITDLINQATGKTRSSEEEVWAVNSRIRPVGLEIKMEDGSVIYIWPSYKITSHDNGWSATARNDRFILNIRKKDKDEYYTLFSDSVYKYLTKDSKSDIPMIENELPVYTQEDDLNGDDKKDMVRLSILDKYHNEYRLQVNETHIYATGHSVEVNFSIVDINSKDQLKEIAVSELGPSDDYKTAFYIYSNNKITLIGKIEGFYSNLPNMPNNIEIDGSGQIVTRTRGAILHTWFFKDYYKLDKNHCLKRVPQDLYEMNTKVEVIKEITLQKSPENPEPAFTLEKGEAVTILACDNREWCLVKNSKGEKGWFAVDGFNTIRGTGLTADAVFKGLCFAD